MSPALGCSTPVINRTKVLLPLLVAHDGGMLAWQQGGNWRLSGRFDAAVMLGQIADLRRVVEVVIGRLIQ